MVKGLVRSRKYTLHGPYCAFGAKVLLDRINRIDRINQVLVDRVDPVKKFCSLPRKVSLLNGYGLDLFYPGRDAGAASLLPGAKRHLAEAYRSVGGEPLLLKTWKGEIMERVDLHLSKLTVAQKLDLMEAIWDDLARQEKTLDAPDWHEDVLKDREKALAAGKATISDWDEAKDRIKRNVS